MCTKLQSAQIDKAKIGKNVKGIPKIWIDRRYIEDLKIEDDEKEFLKRIMLNRHPYFFIHLYADTKKRYKEYIEEYTLSSIHKFGITLDELLIKKDKTELEKKYIKSYYEYMPIIDSKSVMNNICKYIENVDFDIKNKIKILDKNVHLILMRNENIVNKEVYTLVLEEYERFKVEIRLLKATQKVEKNNKYDETKSQSVNGIYKKFKDNMDAICTNTYELVDYLIYIFYVENANSNKDLLWNTYGDIILQNIIDKNQTPILFPIPDKNGDIEYLNNKYKLGEVVI